MLLCEGFTYIYIFHCTCVSHGGIISTNLLQLFLLCWDRRERSFQLWYSLPCRLQAAVQFLCLSYNRKFKHICKLLPGVIFFVRCSFPLNRIVLAWVTSEWTDLTSVVQPVVCTVVQFVVRISLKPKYQWSGCEPEDKKKQFKVDKTIYMFEGVMIRGRWSWGVTCNCSRMDPCSFEHLCSNSFLSFR